MCELPVPVIGLFKPSPVPKEITFIYNSTLNLIQVSFCIFVAFRVRARVRVKVRVSGRSRSLDACVPFALVFFLVRYHLAMCPACTVH